MCCCYVWYWSHSSHRSSTDTVLSCYSSVGGGAHILQSHLKQHHVKGINFSIALKRNRHTNLLQLDILALNKFHIFVYWRQNSNEKLAHYLFSSHSVAPCWPPQNERFSVTASLDYCWCFSCSCWTRGWWELKERKWMKTSWRWRR